MRSFLTYSFFSLALGHLTASPANHVVISEFMADNQSVLADGDGDFSDWIELYNPTSSAVNLTGFYLTDNSAELDKWQMPALTLAAGQRVVIFASDKQNPPPGEFHASFKLSKNGEYLALVNPDGTSVVHSFSPEYPAQSEDISYGIINGDLAQEQFMAVATPDAPNNNTLPAPSSPSFSAPSGTFTNTFQVILTAPDAGASIYYTTNGSSPTTASAILYTGPVSITSSTQLRAVAKLGGQFSAISGGNYIKLSPSLANYQADIPLLIIENFGAGNIPAKGWSGTGAGVQQVPRQDAVWATFALDSQTGIASLSDPPEMSSRIGIRGRGAYSSTWSQKPYSVEATDEQGDERDVSVLGMPTHSDWVLYYPDTDSDKDPPMMFNTFMYDLSNRMGRYACRFRWVEIFINTDGGDLDISDRRGVYAILEKVSRGEGRLDFKKLSTDGSEGGFLVGINRMDAIPVGGFPAENGATSPQHFHTKGPNRNTQTSPNSNGGGDDIPRQSNAYINFENPNGYKITSTQRSAIEGWFETFEDILYDDNVWLDPQNGYRQLLDTADFADYFIFNNLSRNGDGMLISMFPWVGDDNKLRMGPAWDYNWASYYRSGGPTGTLWHRPDRLWYGRLFSDPDFEQTYIDRWFLHRDGALSDAGIDAVIDDQAAAIGAVRAVRQGYSDEADWQSELNTFRNWIKTRANWYDGQFLSRPSFLTNPGTLTQGSKVKLTEPQGTIYFTTDGSDPRSPGGNASVTSQIYDSSGTSTVLLDSNTPLKLLIPTASNPGSGTGWTATSYDDSSWQAGSGGVGYDDHSTYDSHINFDVTSIMDGVNSSAYIRIPFNVTDATEFDTLVLKMKYDDGFVAYLNGHRVTASNEPSSLTYNSQATISINDNDALSYKSFDITAHLDKLNTGANVLAIHGLNHAVSSSDFLNASRLEATKLTDAGGIALTSSSLVKARSYHNGEWSAPIEGYFFIDTIPAAAGNLVVSELNYRPADASPAEAAAGFTDRDDFEFIELMNISGSTLNLTGVKFIRVNDEGIAFDFSNIHPRTLGPGETMLVVKNRAAFEARYGTLLSPQIAGEYDGNLSNDGELITLLDTNNSPIVSFTYNDQKPWPEQVDGDGLSLTLVHPTGNPDHDEPANWRGSTQDGGSPGGSDTTALIGSDLIDYKVIELPAITIDPTHTHVSYTLHSGADAVRAILQSSVNLLDWTDHPAGTQESLISSTWLNNASVLHSATLANPTEGKLFIRLKLIER